MPYFILAPSNLFWCVRQRRKTPNIHGINVTHWMVLLKETFFKVGRIQQPRDGTSCTNS